MTTSTSSEAQKNHEMDNRTKVLTDQMFSCHKRENKALKENHETFQKFNDRQTGGGQSMSWESSLKISAVYV